MQDGEPAREFLHAAHLPRGQARSLVYAQALDSGRLFSVRLTMRTRWVQAGGGEVGHGPLEQRPDAVLICRNGAVPRQRSSVRPLLRTLAAHYPRVWRLVAGSGVFVVQVPGSQPGARLAAATCHKGC